MPRTFSRVPSAIPPSILDDMKYLRYIIPILVLAVFVVPLITGAQDGDVQTKDYLLVEDLPFVNKTTDLAGYLQGIFQLGIGIAVTLAIIMIVYGGIEYMISDIPGTKTDAKGRIRGAIYGLLLVFASWAILYTINPKLVEFRFIQSLQEAAESVEGPSGGSRPDLTPDQEEQSARDFFANNRPPVLINNSPCQGGQTSGCTNVGGLPIQTRTAIAVLAQECGVAGCVVITGGSEEGHVTHGVGKPFADLRKTSTLNQYIQNATNGEVWGVSVPPASYNIYRVAVSGRTHYFMDEGSHWHGCFNTLCNVQLE